LTFIGVSFVGVVSILIPCFDFNFLPPQELHSHSLS
jgi:hypothetical protein